MGQVKSEQFAIRTAYANNTNKKEIWINVLRYNQAAATGSASVVGCSVAGASFSAF